MHGFQAEPTELRDNNLSRIRTLKSLYKRPVGFQDHTAGDSEFAEHVPFVALGAGADVIEKHLTLSRVPQIEDYISALTPEEFLSWSQKIKKIYLTLGKDEWKLTDKERQYRFKVRRAVCSNRKIKRGEIIKESDVILKRTDNQNAIFEVADVIGKRAGRHIEVNSAIQKEDLI
jgi:sialic acid synthase SpsE